MSDAYDADLRKTAHETAEELNLDLPESVYLQVTGPTYETAAESEFYASCGADTVGMSTACETIALRHMGVKVLCFNCVSNYCPNVSGMSDEQMEILLYHELLHVGMDDTGEEVKYIVNPHDVEDFRAVIDRYGIDWAKT